MASEACASEALVDLASLDDDFDSEELDRLEDEAEQEMLEELAREGNTEALHPDPDTESTSDASAPEFGPLSREEIADVLSDLHERGMLACLQRHVLPHPDKVRRFLFHADLDCAAASFFGCDAGRFLCSLSRAPCWKVSRTIHSRPCLS